jgi:hypothetical protein
VRTLSLELLRFVVLVDGEDGRWVKLAIDMALSRKDLACRVEARELVSLDGIGIDEAPPYREADCER